MLAPDARHAARVDCFEQNRAKAESMTISKYSLQRFAGEQIQVLHGLGASRHDPIALQASSSIEASLAEHGIIRGLMREGGHFWREIAVSYVDDGPVIQRKVERITVTDHEVITDTANYYFLRKGLQPTTDPGALPPVYRDDPTGIDFPVSLEWLHFDASEAPQSQEGPRSLLRYGAPAMQATIYVYPAGPGDTHELLDSELTRAIDEITTVHGADAIEHHWDRQVGETSIDFPFVPKSEEPRLSAIKIVLVGGSFLKVRSTFRDEPFMRRAFQQVDVAFSELML